jgi:hypothetical protein
LHGLEEYIKIINPKLGFIRYADDFIVTAKDKKPLENVLIQIKQWLSERGLEISAEKTRIVNIVDGFNFRRCIIMGWLRLMGRRGDRETRRKIFVLLVKSSRNYATPYFRQTWLK